MQDIETPEEEAQTTEEVATTEEVEEQEIEGTVEVVGEVEPDEVDESPKPKTAVQKRIDELTRKRHEADRRAAYAEGQLAAEREKAPEPAKATPDTADMPKEDDYETYDEYIDAKTEFVVEKRLAEMKRQTAEDDEKRRLEDSEKVFKAKLAEGENRYDDFQEVAMNIAVPITNIMADILTTTENPADIAYYLGKNINEAVAISHMIPTQAAREIGKLETKLAAEFKDKPPKATKKITKAPAPVKPSTVSGVISKDPDKMSYEDYRKYREEGGGR